MQRLLVENKELDLGEESVNLTLVMNDLGDISTRNSSYSQTINIPKTSKNIEIFGMLGVIGNNSRKPYEKLRCSFYKNNVTVILDGYLEIAEVNDKYYRCSIYDGIIDLAEKIKDKSIRDLDYSDLNHINSVDDHHNWMDNATGFVYAIANFGHYISLPIQVDTQAPCLFVHTVWDKIMEEAGITYTGDFFNDNEDFYTEVISPSNGYAVGQFTTTKFEEIMADLSQKEFIKDVMQRHGLIMRNGSSPNEIEFKRLDDLLNDRATAVDYTRNFIDLNKEKYTSNYGKKNIASYEYAESIIEPWADGQIVIDNENAEDTNTLFKSPYEIAETTANLNGTTFYNIPLWDTDYDQKETPIKIFRLKKTSQQVTFYQDNYSKIKRGVTFLSLENMTMGYFLGKNYLSFREVLENYKEIDFSLKLNPIEFAGVDFFKLIYLKQFGRFFYLNSVKNKGQIMQAQAIEISKFRENQPVENFGNFAFTMNYGETKVITLADLTQNYFDPEYDAPIKVKIIPPITFGDIFIKQNNMAITTPTVIDVEDLNLIINSTSQNTSTETFKFQIMDSGSGSFGNVTGKIIANFNGIPNEPPVANAGTNQTRSLLPANQTDTIYIPLNGSNSYDSDGQIVKAFWTIISAPSSSLASVLPTTNQVNLNSQLQVPNNDSSRGTYTIRLTVEDDRGATDTDTTQITITKYIP